MRQIEGKVETNRHEKKAKRAGFEGYFTRKTAKNHAIFSRISNKISIFIDRKHPKTAPIPRIIPLREKG